MDFYTIRQRPPKNGVIKLYPDYLVRRGNDLLIKGGQFYAVWDERRGLWNTSADMLPELIDEKLEADVIQKTKDDPATAYWPELVTSYESGHWNKFLTYVKGFEDSPHQLDQVLTYQGDPPRRSDYASKRLPYSLGPGITDAYDELMSIIYDPLEREKIEWAIGAVVSGESRKIQKFLVLYGPGGTGKSTVLEIIQKLFVGYYSTFEAKALTSGNNAFSTTAFASGPLVAIQHDGDLSTIEDNAKLNSIVSHEDMTINEKYKNEYTSQINAFIFMGTNTKVRITDAKSGIIRRLIDAVPTGNRLEEARYAEVMIQIESELGAIAHHCLQVFTDRGRDYYSRYVATRMLAGTNLVYNYVQDNWDIFTRQTEGVSLKQAWDLFKLYKEETNSTYDRMTRNAFRDELKEYFKYFDERIMVDDSTHYSYYREFNPKRFESEEGVKTTYSPGMVLDSTTSLLDAMLADQPAQLASYSGLPVAKWDSVTTTLAEIDTRQLHYVKLPLNHIVIDFDLEGADGEKSAALNLEAANKLPSTYAEHSKSGAGVHLHYLYDGDVDELARLYDTDIEIKVFNGNSSLRRVSRWSNDIPVKTLISGQLPIREKPVKNDKRIATEKGLRDLILRNLRKEIHPGTKPSIDFIKTILQEAYDDGVAYDVTDLRSRIMAFANQSTNQAMACLKVVMQMQFEGQVNLEEAAVESNSDRLVFYDVEVFPNLFVICWKYEGSDEIVKMINPSAQQVEDLMGMRLVGFNCRRYDNHVLYGAYMGYNNEQLYKLSKKLITNEGYFGEAYNVSYTDIYDFTSKKQSLKKYQIELGITHMESAMDWDKPVPENKWAQVAEYCANDVAATEATFKAREQDFVARQILADISGLNVNASTKMHTTKIVFGDDRKPQEKFVYTDLSQQFPGYVFDYGKSEYKGENPGEGGYVYAEPGMYENVALLDVASMHPTSIQVMNLFGPYTKNYTDLMAARLAIKRGKYDDARQMFGGKLAQHLKSEDDAKALSFALKIVINIVYGLTAAKFDNPFRDKRNIDNVVAKRGALFMVDLKAFVQERGFAVAHIKTDSIKIPNATPEIIAQVTEFGEQYGYTFEHEGTYERMCLVNDAVYVALQDDKWTAVGAQFQHPYVYKTLFAPEEEITFEDMCETKQVTSALYLDFDAVAKPMVKYEGPMFIGKIGRFVPVTEESGGGVLVREKDGKMYAATGTKGYFWLEAEMAKRQIGSGVEIDQNYFEALVHDAKAQIAKYGDETIFLANNKEN